MAGIHHLDVRMTLEDLARHFGNHKDVRFLGETVHALKELEADEAASIFLSAWDVVKPHLHETRVNDWQAEDPSDYFDGMGIQAKIGPLNKTQVSDIRRAG